MLWHMSALANEDCGGVGDHLLAYFAKMLALSLLHSTLHSYSHVLQLCHFCKVLHTGLPWLPPSLTTPKCHLPTTLNCPLLPSACIFAHARAVGQAKTPPPPVRSALCRPNHSPPFRVPCACHTSPTMHPYVPTPSTKPAPPSMQTTPMRLMHTKPPISTITPPQSQFAVLDMPEMRSEGLFQRRVWDWHVYVCNTGLCQTALLMICPGSINCAKSLRLSVDKGERHGSKAGNHINSRSANGLTIIWAAGPQTLPAVSHQAQAEAYRIPACVLLVRSPTGTFSGLLPSPWARSST